MNKKPNSVKNSFLTLFFLLTTLYHVLVVTTFKMVLSFRESNSGFVPYLLYYSEKITLDRQDFM